MASTSARSSLERIAQIARQNTAGEPLRPPVVAAQSPFHEVLLRDVAASLPPEVAQRMEECGSVRELHEWIAAGAMYRWAGAYPDSQASFLAALANDPGQASLALAKSVAARMEPPPRDPRWRRMDRLGLSLQLAVVAIALACRGWLAVRLGRLAFDFPAGADGTLLAGAVDLPLLFSEMQGLAMPLVALGCAALWHLFEATLLSRLMEGARRLPARACGLPPPKAWRFDAFHALWFLQAAFLLWWISARALVRLGHVLLAGGWGERAWAAAAALFFLGALGLAARSAGAALRRGSD